ncbi:retrovirus-related pol polyprotein from transposon 297 family protein, partial [Tanacetum coccineum]
MCRMTRAQCVVIRVIRSIIVKVGGASSNEEVNGVYGNRPRNDPFSESYNPGWRNHPNFRWKDDDNRPNNTQQNYGYKPRYEGGDSSNFQQNSYQQRPQQYQNHGQGPSNGQQSNVDQKFDLILSELAKSNQGANLKFESLSRSVVNLERQMGQLAEEVHKREAGKLPSYPTLNPKHKPDGPEHVNMVTSLRSGKTYNNDIKIPSVHDFSHDVEDFVTDDEIVVEGKKADNVKSDSELVNDLLKDFPKPPTQNPKATESPKVGEGGVSSTTTPYPAALEKSASARLAKKGPHSEDMWETFKQVKINLPLIDAIKQIPAYAKFLKDLCTQKRKLKATLPKKIDLTEHVSAVLSSSLPPKFKDPGAPLISVVVGNIAIKKALLDLGASINILLDSLVDKYDLGTLFDFFVMDTESPYKDVQPTIILRRPFLATIYARINCRTSPMDIMFGNKKLRLNVFNSVNSPTMNECYQVDVIDEEVQKHAPHMLKDDHLDLYLTGENDEILDVAEPLPANFDTATKPSLEVHPTLELKHLPANLKYAFLGPNNSLPVIVASDLFGSQEEALLKVLSKYKAAVGWTIADLKGISPSLCMHRIVTDSFFLQNILDLYFKHFKLPEDVVNRILQVVLDLQHFKSSLFIFAATILQSSPAIHHISNIDNFVHQIIKFQSILITSRIIDMDKEMCQGDDTTQLDGNQNQSVNGSQEDESQEQPFQEEDTNLIGNKRKLTSDVWPHFDRKVINGELKAECKYCHKKLAGSSRSGTSHLREHITKRCKRRKIKDIRQQVLSMGQKTPGGPSNLSCYRFDENISRQDLAEMIIVHEYPLVMVEHHGFRKFVRGLQPLFTVPCRNTVKSDVFKIYDFKKQKTMRILEKNASRIAITTDMWTSSNQKKGFMTITAHYIDDNWNLQSRLMRFIYVPCPHTADVLANVLYESLCDWNIDR